MSRDESAAATSYDPLDARLGRTSSEPVETTKGKPVRSRPLRKKSDAATTALEALLVDCRRIVDDVEVKGIHVAATGNAYGIARELLDSLKEAESRV